MLIKNNEDWVEVAAGTCVLQRGGVSNVHLTYSVGKPTGVPENVFTVRHNFAEVMPEVGGKTLWGRSTDGDVRLAVELVA